MGMRYELPPVVAPAIVPGLPLSPTLVGELSPDEIDIRYDFLEGVLGRPPTQRETRQHDPELYHAIAVGYGRLSLYRESRGALSSKNPARRSKRLLQSQSDATHTLLQDWKRMSEIYGKPIRTLKDVLAATNSKSLYNRALRVYGSWARFVNDAQVLWAQADDRMLVLGQYLQIASRGKRRPTTLDLLRGRLYTRIILGWGSQAAFEEWMEEVGERLS